MKFLCVPGELLRCYERFCVIAQHASVNAAFLNRFPVNTKGVSFFVSHHHGTRRLFTHCMCLCLPVVRIGCQSGVVGQRIEVIKQGGSVNGCEFGSSGSHAGIPEGLPSACLFPDKIRTLTGRSEVSNGGRPTRHFSFVAVVLSGKGNKVSGHSARGAMLSC